MGTHQIDLTMASYQTEPAMSSCTLCLKLCLECVSCFGNEDLRLYHKRFFYVSVLWWPFTRPNTQLVVMSVMRDGSQLAAIRCSLLRIA